ncbi:uncharacterized protein ARMOST_16441 [Armillaria ostoyae]|uniref:Uncharacterized protein n=1 Tax=Armillaria ostoyae TaxID=47428 RepID=A0A284RW98_ARMOS|nr:uncharacterized protein ARMOST_16441 [Armillaria ostoyae]
MPAPATSSSKLHRRSSPANTKRIPVANPKTNPHQRRLPASSDEETQPRHRQGHPVPASRSAHAAQQPAHRIGPRSAQQPANRIESKAPAATRRIAPPVACPETPPLTSDHEIHDDSDMDDADHIDDTDHIDNDNAALETINESGDSSHSADEDVEVGRKCKRSSHKARKLWKKKLADYETNAEKKAYIKDTCLSLGRYLPRAVDLWVDADDLVWAGMKQAERAEKMNKSVHDLPAKTRTEASFAVLLKLMERDVTFLDVFGVYKTEQTAVKAIVDSLHEGVKEGRATDTNKVWTHILTLMLKDPRNDAIAKPAPTSKSFYGFNHIDTGRLLCPQVYFEGFDEDFLLSLSDGRIEVNASYWPSFMYDQAMWTPKDEEIGLTRGYLLLRVLFLLSFVSEHTNPVSQGTATVVILSLAITSGGKDRSWNMVVLRMEVLKISQLGNWLEGTSFYSPFTVPLLLLCSVISSNLICDNGDPTKQEGKKRRNIAKINRMHQVTGRHIAYAACQTRYALSSKTAWCEQDGAFNMNTFYVAIVDLFEQYPDDEWVTATLGWWNEQVFGNAKGCMVTEAEKQEHAPESSVGKITAARAARARARAEALALVLEAESSGDDS